MSILKHFSVTDLRQLPQSETFKTFVKEVEEVNNTKFNHYRTNNPIVSRSGLYEIELCNDKEFLRFVLDKQELKAIVHGTNFKLY